MIRGAIEGYTLDLLARRLVVRQARSMVMLGWLEGWRVGWLNGWMANYLAGWHACWLDSL